MHVWSTNRRLNKSRNKPPRVQPLLAPEHARAPGPVCPHRAMPDPVPSPEPMPIKQPKGSAVLPRTPSVLPKPEFAGLSPEHDAPPPAITARARPPWPALPIDPQPRPSPWTASPRGYEAFPSLSRDIASPEKRAQPHQTKADRCHAWTKPHSKPFPNSLHPRHH
jgi:serralysin